MLSITFCNIEKSRLRKPAQQLQPSGLLVECLHTLQVIHPQRDFSEGLDFCFRYATSLIKRKLHYLHTNLYPELPAYTTKHLMLRVNKTATSFFDSFTQWNIQHLFCNLFE